MKVPVLCILIGEGGSGGALATAVGNEVWMMENATYSILSPEGFASILWKDADRAREASEVMNITSNIPACPVNRSRRNVMKGSASIKAVTRGNVG